MPVSSLVVAVNLSIRWYCRENDRGRLHIEGRTNASGTVFRLFLLRSYPVVHPFRKKRFLTPLALDTADVPPDRLAKALGDFYDADAAKYEIVSLQGDKFLDALKQLVGAAEPEAAE
jgi:hypothetical protein